jgi:predicted nucleic acid-binding protein
MIVVADTGPIHYLILCNQAFLLRELFGSVLIPPAVHLELTHPHTPQAVRAWAAAMPEWAMVRPPQDASRFGNLGPGEREAISLALESKADFVLMDETLGRRVAVQKRPGSQGDFGSARRSGCARVD